MDWITPKTDWNGDYKYGKYVGDYFRHIDYNRIKNNLNYLYEIANEYFTDIPVEDLGEDKILSDLVFAAEINAFENNLDIINRYTVNKNYGQKREYYENAPFIDFNELNRIESAMLDLFRVFNTDKKRKFVWNFGKGLGL